MQYKVAKLLNKLLVIITALILVLAAGYFVIYRYFPVYKTGYLIGFVVVSVVALFLFHWLESQWDKRVITRMAKAGQIALATVTGGSRVMRMRDTAFVSYWLYEFQGVIHTPDGKSMERKFYEKMNFNTDKIPAGSFYVTYDEEKPSQIFIIPNALIANLPDLQPVVQRFENNKQLKIKYLDVHYNKGMVVRSFREAVAEQQHRLNQKKLEQQQKEAAKKAKS